MKKPVKINTSAITPKDLGIPKSGNPIKSIAILIGKVYTSLTTLGIKDTLRIIGERMYGLGLDWRLGIRTSDVISSYQLGYNNPSYAGYISSSYHTLHKVMRMLETRKGKDVFLDYGSGMGRTIITAAMLPFREVIGIELNAELNIIAEKNIQRLRPKLICKDVHVITADAITYTPPDDATIFYFFNPFGDEIMSRVFANIHESLMSHPRDITVVYIPPPRNQRCILDNYDWLTKRLEVPNPFPRDRVIRIYRN